MKQLVLTVIVALVAGVTGAAVTSYFAKPTLEKRPAPIARHAGQPERPTVIPPGWNLELLGRVGALERELADLKQEKSAKTESTTPSEPSGPEPSEREAEREAQYQEELRVREERLVALAAEPIDVSWSRTQSAELRDALAQIAGPDAVKSIDCRSKGCAGVMTFPSPGEALVAMGSKEFPRFLVNGCKAVSIIPTPPESAGPYDLTILYGCR